MADSSDNCGDSEHASVSSTSSETSRSSSFSSEASKEYSKQAKRRKKRKHVEDWWDFSDTGDPIETKKRKKNQVTKHKIFRKKRKTKKRRKSWKDTERLLKRIAREQDVIFTALVRMDKNDSRIPVLFSLISSCAASFAAFKGKVLEACGLSLKNVICIKISKSNCVKLLDGQYAYDSTDLSLILTTADDEVVELMLKGVSPKALAQLDKHSDEQSLQRICEHVTTTCGQIDKMVRTDVPEL